MDAFVGIDVGTSSVKAIVVDPEGRVLSSASEPLTLETPQPGWAEQDPDAWWQATIAALKSALSGDLAARVAAVGLSGQMHSSVFLDRAGKVIRPALLWCDGRTTEQCRQITREIGERKLRRLAANAAFEGFTLPKLLWLRQHEPAAYKKLSKLLLPKDYIRYRLSGVLASEPSDASATLLYDTAARRWSQPLVRALKLDPSILPDLGESASVLGTITSEAAQATGLVQGTPVVGGGADNACGAIGVGVVAPGDAVASWGTSGTVLAPTREPLVDAGMRAHTFCHAVPDTWYVMGVMLTAGAAFAWYRRELARELNGGAEQLLNDEAEAVPAGSDGLLFLPYLQGERTPHRDAAARGAFVGLSLAHHRAHMSRAVLEGICYGLRDSLEILNEIGINPKRLLLTGGGAKSAFVRQLQADVYGVPVARALNEEGPAFGAALLAAVGAGAFSSVAQACKKTLERAAPERPNRARHRIYDAGFSRYKALYPALKPVLSASATA
jgi:xylulokinase